MAEQAPSPQRGTDKVAATERYDTALVPTGLGQAPTVQRLRGMANTLNARLAAPAQRAANGFAQRAVVQAKFKFLDTVLAEKNLNSFTIPARLTSYRTSAKIYQIRDDWDADFEKPIHLIGPDSVYLMGEFHDRSTWATQTAEWSRIAKSREGSKSFPGFEEEEPDRKDLPLDSMHAFLLHVALMTHGYFLRLKANKDAIPPAAITSEIVWSMGQIEAAESGYKSMLAAIVESDDEENNAAEVAFIKKFSAQYVNSAGIVKFLAERLVALAAVKAPSAKDKTDAAELKGLVLGEDPFLGKLANDLTVMSGIKSKSAKGKAITAEAASDIYVAPSASAALSVRDAAMAKNVEAAGKPLLVQMGDAHVEGVAALVAGSTKVRADDTLEKHTKV